MNDQMPMFDDPIPAAVDAPKKPRRKPVKREKVAAPKPPKKVPVKRRKRRVTKVRMTKPVAGVLEITPDVTKAIRLLLAMEIQDRNIALAIVQGLIR